MKNWKKILLGLFVIMIIIQFIPVDRGTPDLDQSQDFITATQPPEPIATMLKNACYDCHSDETKYPWYANVAPASWWLQGHINEGRHHLNFSRWATTKKKSKAMEEAAEEVEKGKMPLNSYTWLHAEARLSDAEKQQLIYWLQQKNLE